MGGGSSRSLVIPQEETEEERQQRARLPATINPPEVPLSLIPNDYFLAEANNPRYNPALTPVLDNFIYGPIVPVNTIQNLSNNEEKSSKTPVAKPFVRK